MASAPAPAKPSSEPSLMNFIIKTIVGFVLIIIVFVIIGSNAEVAISFIKTLKIVQLLAFVWIVLAIAFAFWQMHKFTPLNMALGEGYGQKYKPPSQKALDNYFEIALDKIEKHLDSDNMSEWKLAIIELDNLLKDALTTARYEGETIADKLKNLSGENSERSLSSIESAWEAHKIRNKIAHEGMGFTIDKREAKRVYFLYKSVFMELGLLSDDASGVSDKDHWDKERTEHGS